MKDNMLLQTSTGQSGTKRFASFSVNGVVASLFLRLVAAETVVEVLPRWWLRPLRLGSLLAATKATGTLRRSIPHRRARKAGGGSGVRPAKVALLTAELSRVLAC